MRHPAQLPTPPPQGHELGVMVLIFDISKIVRKDLSSFWRKCKKHSKSWSF